MESERSVGATMTSLRPRVRNITGIRDELSTTVDMVRETFYQK
jgi:hypothetical protein